jgi:hypothetical protein
MELSFWVAFSLFVYAFYKWAVVHNGYFLERNVKFIKPWPLLGSSSNFFTQKLSMSELMVKFYNSFASEK